MENSNKIIFVTGATGKQGGAVVNHLLKNNWKVRALTRNPNKPEALALKERGIELIKGDMEKPGTFKEVLDGVYGAYSVQNFWEHGYDGELHQGIAFADAAKEAGVRHFVYSSVGSAHRQTGLSHFESKFVIENHIKEIGLPYTIFRPVFFMENFLYMKEMILNGKLKGALEPDIPLQMIAVDNVGTFVEMAFAEPDVFIGKELDIAGDSKTFPEVASILSSIIGKNVEYIKQDMAQYEKENGKEYALMIDWFNNVGYNVDIGMLRETFDVDLISFKDWARSSQFAIKDVNVR